MSLGVAPGPTRLCCHGLSFEDIGTGVMVFLFAALALGLGLDQAETARRVVTSAGIAGVAAMLIDRFIV